MKKIFLLLMSMLATTTAFAELKVVNVATAGTLGDLLTDNEVNTLTDLKVTGCLNGTDIRLIRKMSGAENYTVESGYGSQRTKKTIKVGNLKNLDLSEANIVSGGSTFRIYVFGGPAYAMEDPYSLTENDVLSNDFFSNCSNLETLIMPKSVKEMKDYVVYACLNMKYVKLPDVSELGYGTFDCCSSLQKVDLPKTVKKIGMVSFMMNRSLKEVNMPSVESIDDSTFYLCDSLERVSFGAIQRLGRAFIGIKSLKYIELPEDLTKISAEAFAECSKLGTIISLASVPPECESSTFNGVSSQCNVYVNLGCAGSYKAAVGWKDLNIIEKDLTGLSPIKGSSSEVKQYYNLEGQQLSSPQKGLNIVKYANGEARKVLVK